MIQKLLIHILLIISASFNILGQGLPEKGEKVPEISMPDAKGNTINLSSLKGTITVIHFWASWCGYSRSDNVFLKDYYDSYKKNGLNIFSVSLDIEKKHWLDAILEDHLNWPTHVCDFKGWNTKPVGDYNIDQLPTYILLDETGRVMDTYLDIKKLGKKLKWYYEDQVFQYPKTASTHIYFSEKTDYKIKNTKGDIVLKGKGNEVSLFSLPRGKYMIEYGNKEDTFYKMDLRDERVSFYPTSVTDIITLSEKSYFELYNEKGRLLGKGIAKEIDTRKYYILPGTVNYLAINGIVNKFIKKN